MVTKMMTRSDEGSRAPTAEVVIRTEDVTFAVDGRELVSGISFSLRAGEVVALVGPNGAGKSTMLSLLAGDVAPTQGRVEISGIDVRSWKSGPLARKRSVMLQHNSSNFSFSVRGSGAYGPSALGRRPCARGRKARRRSDRGL